MRNNVVVGVSFAVVGFGLMLIIAPYFSALGSRAWLDETFVVPGFYYCCYYGLFPSKTALHIAFEVVQGGDRSLEFLVMDEENFQKMEANETFAYYEEISRKSISHMELDWVPPSEKTVYFVWRNIYSFDAKSVSAYFSWRPSVTVYTYFGVVLLLGGFAASGYGTNMPSSSSSRRLIVVGYIFAALGGVIGLLLGVELSRRDNTEDNSHGKIILAIGAIATISYILLLLL